MDVEYQDHPYEANVGYMRKSVSALDSRGIKLDSLLDIGAAHGNFSELFQDIWTEAKITAMECNDLDSYYLDRHTNWDVKYLCLGDKPCKKTFHMDKNDAVSMGASFYKEDTQHFDGTISVEKDIVTLDSLKLPPQDFIKIDTQGSEVDIIKGGQNTIKNARFLLIECSFVEYNEGGCLIDDVIRETQKLGFRIMDTFGVRDGAHYHGEQRIQVDVLFAKENEKVFGVV